MHTTGGHDTSAHCPRLLIAGVSSGVGKTTFTLGLCRALMRRGLRVALFKCGPDYLDPSYHRRASHGPAHNLDSWLMPHGTLQTTFADHARAYDISVVEGVMGLFDGASGSHLTGSSAEIAQLLGCPIVLVCDASGMARSTLALIHGFATFEPTVAPAAVICNRIGSAGHLALLKRAEPCKVPILGGLPKHEAGRLPERHLGLVTADELDLEATLEGWADHVEAHCDVAALLALAHSAQPLTHSPRAAPKRNPRCRIGVAQDAAFHFYYEANLRLLEAAGATLVRFSPLADAALPDVDGLYLGGGYPELHAAKLAANHSMLSEVRAHARNGKPVYAECGGLMYLGDALVDQQGVTHQLVGLIRGTAHMQPKLQALGYAEAQVLTDSPLGPKGTCFRGHQFRYSRFESDVAPSRLSVRSVRSDVVHIEGYGHDNVLGTYVHAHWASNPAIPEAFVAACVRTHEREGVHRHETPRRQETPREI